MRRPGIRAIIATGRGVENEAVQMRHVVTNADLEAIHCAGDGLILNDYPSVQSAAQYKVLHLAWCSGVGRMLGRVGTSAPSVPKIFFEAIDEADAWLALHRGPAGTGWKPCDTCLPGHNAEGGARSAERLAFACGRR
jgi:hypothetical protein